MLIRRSIKSGMGLLNKAYKTKGGIWISSDDLFLPHGNNILLLLEGLSGRRLMGAHNIITNDGDQWYAEAAASETPTNALDDLFLSTVAFSPTPVKASDAGDLASVIAGAESAEDATYPKTNDADADNTGSGVDVVTHRFSYTAAAFNDASIEGLAIAVTGTTWGSGTNPLLNAANLASFAKAATDTLKIFVNHEMAGV